MFSLSKMRFGGDWLWLFSLEPVKTDEIELDLELANWRAKFGKVIRHYWVMFPFYDKQKDSEIACYPRTCLLHTERSCTVLIRCALIVQLQRGCQSSKQYNSVQLRSVWPHRKAENRFSLHFKYYGSVSGLRIFKFGFFASYFIAKWRKTYW